VPAVWDVSSPQVDCGLESRPRLAPGLASVNRGDCAQGCRLTENGHGGREPLPAVVTVGWVPAVSAASATSAFAVEDVDRPTGIGDGDRDLEAARLRVGVGDR